MYDYKEDSPLGFISWSVLPLFWIQGYTSLIKWVGKVSLIFNFLVQFVWEVNFTKCSRNRKFYLKSSPDLGLYYMWAFLAGECTDYQFYFFTSYGNFNLREGWINEPISFRVCNLLIDPRVRDPDKADRKLWL